MLKQSVMAVALTASILNIGSNAFAQSARDYISIVGSSTVYPFSTVVAERFGKTSDFKTPKVESTGSGGGLKLFCSGSLFGRQIKQNLSSVRVFYSPDQTTSKLCFRFCCYHCLSVL